MKKRMISALLLCGLMASLCACSAPFTCDLCGQESNGKKHEYEMFGEKATICDTCYEDIASLFG